MASAVDVLREVLALTENVKGLKEEVSRLVGDVTALRERVVRLEAREEIVVERTRNAAIMAVNRMHADLLERLLTIEATIAATTHTAQKPRVAVIPQTSERAPDGSDT